MPRPATLEQAGPQSRPHEWARVHPPLAERGRQARTQGTTGEAANDRFVLERRKQTRKFKANVHASLKFPPASRDKIHV